MPARSARRSRALRGGRGQPRIRASRRSRARNCRRSSIEVSVLGPLEAIDPRLPGAFIIGRHGLVVEQGSHRGLLLPQVAIGVGLDGGAVPRPDLRESGSASGRLAARCRVYRFDAEVFGRRSTPPGHEDAPARCAPVDRRRPAARASTAREASRCEALQIFTKSAGQWRAAVPLPAGGDRAVPPSASRETGIRPVVAHNSYLINIAAADPALRRAIDRRARRGTRSRGRYWGSTALSCIPGSYTSGTEAAGARGSSPRGSRGCCASGRSSRAGSCSNTPPGQGTNLGHRFEHLASILDRLDGSPRVGVCLDTCHLLTAGYDLCSDDGYVATFDEFDRRIGLDRLALFHRERLEEAVRQPRRSSRAHWQGMSRTRAVPPAAERSAVRAPADAARDAEARHAAKAGAAATSDPWDMRNLRTLRRLMQGIVGPL